VIDQLLETLEVLTDEKPSIKQKLGRTLNGISNIEAFLKTMTQRYESIKSGVEAKFSPQVQKLKHNFQDLDQGLETLWRSLKEFSENEEDIRNEGYESVVYA
jgi:hypothetical protein